MNIYVTEELKKQMQAFPGLPWSQIACAAFAKAIEEDQEARNQKKIAKRRLEQEHRDRDRVLMHRASREETRQHFLKRIQAHIDRRIAA